LLSASQGHALAHILVGPLRRAQRGERTGVHFAGICAIFTTESSRPIGLRPVIESPCTRVCTLDPASGLCLGCGRSLDEIARWTQMTDAERARVVAEAGRRSAARRPLAL
jgi:uncharacterized protein